MIRGKVMICSICGVNETDNPDWICEWREMGWNFTLFILRKVCNHPKLTPHSNIRIYQSLFNFPI